jgi:hypothetical protein
LPWDHLEGPLPKATLAKHHQQAFEAMELGFGVDSPAGGLDLNPGLPGGTG